MTSFNDKIIYTVGHSNHAIDKFIALLKTYEIRVVIDVRSSPYSRYCPQFNQDTLASALKKSDIDYVYLGNELGARPDNACRYENGRVSFLKIIKSDSFNNGIHKVLCEMQNHKIVLLCSEKDPINCHRTIIISHFLSRYGVHIQHILENGAIEEHYETEKRLLKTMKIERSLFGQDATEESLIEEAYSKQAKNISYPSGDST